MDRVEKRFIMPAEGSPGQTSPPPLGASLRPGGAQSATEWMRQVSKLAEALGPNPPMTMETAAKAAGLLRKALASDQVRQSQQILEPLCSHLWLKIVGSRTDKHFNMHQNFLLQQSSLEHSTEALGHQRTQSDMRINPPMQAGSPHEVIVWDNYHHFTHVGDFVS